MSFACSQGREYLVFDVTLIPIRPSHIFATARPRDILGTGSTPWSSGTVTALSTTGMVPLILDSTNPREMQLKTTMV